jgi:hypothetical protein
LDNRREDYDDLLANIRRLTVMVLDNLEAGTRDNTVDQGQKRLLGSTGGASFEALASCSPRRRVPENSR